MMPPDLPSLRQFLIDANAAGYAAGDSKQWVTEPDGSTSITYAAGEWRSHDNFFGGEPYGGRVIVHHQDRPVWIMVYYGWVAAGHDPDAIYGFLRRALMHMPADAPYRGPARVEQGEFIYLNEWAGDLIRFSGVERITQTGAEVYRADYSGGWVDQRRGL